MIYTVLIVVSIDCMHILSLIPIGAKILNAFKIWNLALLPIYILSHKKNIQTKDVFLCILFIPFFYIYVGELNLINFVLKVISRFVPIFSFLLLDDRSKLKVVKNWVYLYCVTLVPAVIIHILKFGLSIDFPVNTVTNFMGKSYDTHFFIYYYYKFNYIRFCGLYDEPGVIGTFSYLFLIFMDNHLSRFQKFVLWITGLFSLSFFFILSIPLIILLHLIKRKQYFKLASLTFLGIIFASIAPTIVESALKSTNSSSVYQDLIFHTLKSRFDIDEKSGSVGSIKTNRLNSERYTMDDFLKDDKLTIVMGNFATSDSKSFGELSEGGLGLEIYLFQYGILFFLYTFLMSFLINILPQKNGVIYFFTATLLTLLCLYQRPFLYKIEFVVIFYVGALLFRIRGNSDKVNAIT